MNDVLPGAFDNGAAGADFTERFAGVPSFGGVAGGWIVDFTSGCGGTLTFETGTGPAGFPPPAYAGETTPTTNATETAAATTRLRRRRKADNRDSNRV